jgi:hypothetical protein
MAIKYAGDKNLIGYGAAQVYKDKDLTKGVKEIAGRQERERVRKGKAAAAKKKAADDGLAKLLKENDLSKVRNADIDYLTEEFDGIIKQAGSVISKGGNPATDLGLQKRLNEYRSNTAQSALGRERYDANLKLVTENDDYKGNDNVASLQAENQSAMFGDGANYFDGEAEGEEGTDSYVEGASGNQISRLTPNLHIEEFYKTNTENIKPQAITMTQDGKFTLPASGGNYLTFETRKEASDAQLEIAAKGILANHPYAEDFQASQSQAAIDNGFYSIDEETDEIVPDTLAYVKQQVASRTGEVDMTGVKDIKPKGTYVNVSTGDKQMAAAGEKFDTDVYTMPGVRTNEKGESVVVPDLEYQTVDIPAVYKDVKQADGSTKKELVTPERTGQTFNFGQNKNFDVRPGDAGYMIFGQSKEMKNAGLNPGFQKGGENIQFVPNSIVFKPTADAEMTIKVDGVNQKFQKGEALDVAAVKALEAENQAGYSSMPWLEGRDKNGMTVSVGFNESVHARFSTFVTYNSKQDRAVYENVMRGIGVDPLKKRAKKR